MKISCTKTKFSEAVAFACSIVDKKHLVAIYKNILIKAKNDIVTVYATDGEVGVIIEVPGVIVEEEGALLADGHRLNMSFRQWAVGTEEIIVESAEDGCVVRASGFKCSVFSADPDNKDPSLLPMMQTFDYSKGVSFTGDKLFDLIKKTEFAASLDKARYALNGVLVKAENEVLTFVATDTHRLSVATNPIPNSNANFSELIPVRALRSMKKLITDGDQVIFGFERDHVYMKTSYATVYGRLVNGRFPPYEKPFDIVCRYTVSVNKQVFEKKLSQACIHNSQDHTHLILKFEKGELNLLSYVPGCAETSVRVPISQYQGEPVSIKVNYKNFVELLKALNAGEVVLSFHDGKTPIFVEEGNFKHVIVPIAED